MEVGVSVWFWFGMRIQSLYSHGDREWYWESARLVTRSDSVCDSGSEWLRVGVGQSQSRHSSRLSHSIISMCHNDCVAVRVCHTHTHSVTDCLSLGVSVPAKLISSVILIQYSGNNNNFGLAMFRQWVRMMRRESEWVTDWDWQTGLTSTLQHPTQSESDTRDSQLGHPQSHSVCGVRQSLWSARTQF